MRLATTAALLGRALAIILLAACEHAFEPFTRNDEVGYSMFGVLDLYADTQWIRVMPVRENVFLTPEPLDAVVTLENLATGRVVTLRDSLFAFRDPGFEGVGYAHNFWTTEKLAAGGKYRLKAVRSDGGSSTVEVEIPERFDLTFRNDVAVIFAQVATISTSSTVAFVETMLQDTSGNVVYGLAITPWKRDAPSRLSGLGMEAYGLGSRYQVRVTAVPPGWPYHPGLSDFGVARSGTPASNVVNGYGFVGGIAARVIPFHRCEVRVPRPLLALNCISSYTERSASIEGRVVRHPCGGPLVLADVGLIETFPDGASVIRRWKTGYDGEFRYEGIEPGTELVLEVRPWVPQIPPVTRPLSAPAVRIPPLGPGEHYRLDDIVASAGC